MPRGGSSGAKGEADRCGNTGRPLTTTCTLKGQAHHGYADSL